MAKFDERCFEAHTIFMLLQSAERTKQDAEQIHSTRTPGVDQPLRQADGTSDAQSEGDGGQADTSFFIKFRTKIS